MNELLTRRRFLIGAGAASLLAGCDRVRPISGLLSGMKEWNEKFQELLFSTRRLAPELPPSATTPEVAFPSYFISESMPLIPADWALRVGGMVARQRYCRLINCRNCRTRKRGFNTIASKDGRQWHHGMEFD